MSTRDGSEHADENQKCEEQDRKASTTERQKPPPRGRNFGGAGVEKRGGPR